MTPVLCAPPGRLFRAYLFTRVSNKKMAKCEPKQEPCGVAFLYAMASWRYPQTPLSVCSKLSIPKVPSRLVARVVCT